MIPGAFKARSSPQPWIWSGVLLGLGLLTLGVVHHESARLARAKSAAEPLRPIVVVDLATNREARHGAALDEIEVWTAAVGSLARPVEIYGGDSLVQLLPRRYAAWVLPQQEQLADDDWEALDRYLASGGGVVVTGRTGRQDPSGALRGRSALEQLFPGERFRRFTPGEATPVRVVGRDPLAAGLEPGARLVFAAPGRELRASSAAALAWSDAAADAAALHGIHRGAPVAWLGFGPQRLADPALAARITTNAVRFAARQPVLDLRPWPDGRPCAVLVGGEGDDVSESACRSPVAAPDEAELARLAGEGCRWTTVRAGERVLPEVVSAPGASLVAIPEPDAHHESEGAVLLRELLADYEQAERMGSVFSLRVDEASRRRPERRKLVDSVGAELGARGAWFASPDELAEWWRARTRVEARLQVLGPDSARIWFRNGGESEARDVTARVYLPEGSVTPRLETGLFRRARLRLATDRSWLELVARPLDPGEEVSYTIRF